MVGHRGVYGMDCSPPRYSRSQRRSWACSYAKCGPAARAPIGRRVVSGWIASHHVTRGRKDGAGLAVMLNAGQRPALPLSAALFRDGLLSAMFLAVAKTARAGVKTQYRHCEPLGRGRL